MPPKKVAAIVTEYRKWSHADVIVGKIAPYIAIGYVQVVIILLAASLMARGVGIN